MRRFGLALAVGLVLGQSALAADLSKLSAYAVQICEKGFSCAQAQMGDVPPEMKAQMEQMMATMKSQCQSNASMATGQVPAEADSALLDELERCYASMAGASCDYYVGEQDFETLPGCEGLEQKAEALDMQLPNQQ
tara:strand:- start:384 stop:791 length:408 start_codon:yes stop_codon:yes gene_type:complete